MSRTADRAKVIDFTVPLHTENYGIITTEGKPIAKLADLNSESITLIQVRGTTPIPYLAKVAPKAKVVLLDNYTDRNRALAQGRGDASFDGIDTVGIELKAFPSSRCRNLA
jgi:polar amino acid transport system substrate-binding protein